MKSMVVGSFVGGAIGSLCAYAFTGSVLAAAVGFFICMLAMVIRVIFSD